MDEDRQFHRRYIEPVAEGVEVAATTREFADGAAGVNPSLKVRVERVDGGVDFRTAGGDTDGGREISGVRHVGTVAGLIAELNPIRSLDRN